MSILDEHTTESIETKANLVFEFENKISDIIDEMIVSYEKYVDSWRYKLKHLFDMLFDERTKQFVQAPDTVYFKLNVGSSTCQFYRRTIGIDRIKAHSQIAKTSLKRRVKNDLLDRYLIDPQMKISWEMER